MSATAGAGARHGRLGRVGKLLGLRFGLPHARRGDAARHLGAWIDAVVAYRLALEWMPWRDDLKVQIGNCLREVGDFEGAIRTYRTAEAGPSRIEALQQIAETGRRAGKTSLPYLVDEQPGETTRSPVAPPAVVTATMLPNRVMLDADDPRRWLGSLGRNDGMARRLKGNGYASIKLDQIGSMSLERDGIPEPMLGGIVAIRGRILAFRTVATIDIALGDDERAITVATAPARVVRLGRHPLKLHVFNVWIDVSRLPSGRHWLSVRAGGRIAPAGAFVNIVAVEPSDALATSAALVPAPIDPVADIDGHVLAMPTSVRPAARSPIPSGVRSLLAIRADQLGDVSASLPALARLRTLCPDAHIAALVQPGVGPIIAASGIVDEVLTIELPYDAITERRALPPAEETRLRGLLSERHFDLAVDLSPGDETRPLLLLAGATYLAGFNPDRFPYLDLGIAVRSRDKVNQLECVSHAALVLALVETLATMLAPKCAAVPRVTDAQGALAACGLEAGCYVLIHTGARHAINEWPMARFVELAQALVARTALRVAVIAHGAGAAAWDGVDAARVPRFDTLDPDTFDAVVANAALMIGNDSGPKHLAAVRGVPTVSIQVGRLNWNEWGQDGSGTILSKRVPCTGCGLNDIALCGKDAACIRTISVQDVLDAALAELQRSRLS